MSQIRVLMRYATETCRKDALASHVDDVHRAFGGAASQMEVDLCMRDEEIDETCLDDPHVVRAVLALEDAIAKTCQRTMRRMGLQSLGLIP